MWVKGSSGHAGGDSLRDDDRSAHDGDRLRQGGCTPPLSWTRGGRPTGNLEAARNVWNQCMCWVQAEEKRETWLSAATAAVWSIAAPKREERRRTEWFKHLSPM